MVLASSCPAADADDLDTLLARERWRDAAYGFSFRLPAGSKVQSRSFDDARVRIVADKFTIYVYEKTINQDMTIDKVAKAAMEQFGFLQPTMRVIDERQLRPGRRPGWLQIFGVNLPAAAKGIDEKADPKEVLEVHRTQMRMADALRLKKNDIEAYRVYRLIAANCPDRELAKKAGDWVKHYEVQQDFVERLLRDAGKRKLVNPRDVDDKPWIMGQAFVLLSPQIVFAFRMETDLNDYQEARKVFDAILASVEVQDPRELDKLREQLLNKGEVLQKTLTHDRLVAAMYPAAKFPIVDNDGKPAGHADLRLQYYRITESEKEIGWMKIVHRERRDNIKKLEVERVIDPKSGLPRMVRRPVEVEAGVLGTSVDVYARMHMGQRAVDSHSQHFLSHKRDYESWSIRTTVRERKEFAPGEKPVALPGKPPAPAAPAAPAAAPGAKPAAPQVIETTWLETGVRNGDVITIIRESPTGIDRFTWQKPRVGYISQIELFLMAPLIPRDNQDYGFYAYYPNTGTISYRTIRAVAGGDDAAGFRVYSRPAPDASEQVSEYNTAGQLLRRALAEGRDIVPTTREDLAKLWNLKLPDESAAPADPAEVKPLPPSNRTPR